MRKFKVMVLTLLLISTCSTLVIANDIQVEKLFAVDYKIITSIDQIPANLKKGVEEFIQTFLDMANPQQEFQEDDVIQGPVTPTRRLIFAGVSDQYSFIYYAHGGFVRNDCLIFVENSKTSSKVVFSGIFFKGPAHSIMELKGFLGEDWFKKTTIQSGNF